MAKVFYWKSVPILWRYETSLTQTWIIFYRPDKALERKYLVPTIDIDHIDKETICDIYEDQLNEFISLKSCSLSKTSEYSLPQTSTRFEGLSLLETGAFEQAIAIFGNLLSQDLQDPVRHIDHSRALYACQQYTEAIKGFKKAIALTRRRNRLQQEAHSNENESVLLPCVCSEDIILYSAYTYLGKCYQSLNRVDRAIASYTLAIKIFRPSDSSASYEWDVFGVGDSQSFLSQLLCCRQSEEPPTLDIEDYLKDYALTSINSPFNFNCTMCGECCRTSDRILLTPHDIFLLTRSPTLRFLGIQTTTALLSHPRFEGVFHYTKKDMLPLCSLRPIKENNGCRFAYPLYSRKLKTADSQCELVPFEESDGLTSAGIEIALREGGWIRVMNKSGRQSLGCMLGMSAMPNLCASYPVAPELSQVDFWHVRRSFWRKRRAASKPLSCGHSTEENSISTSEVGLRLASGWQYEENYVISRDNLCEGFGAQSCIENQTIHSFLSKAIAPSSEKQTTTESLSTLERWEESQWFYALLEDISSFLPMELITNKSIQLTLVNRLALIWYNFDSLSSSKSRPIKSYRRLKKDIETLTWILIKETKKFLENMTTSTSDSNDPLCEAEVSISYENLLQRLHVN